MDMVRPSGTGGLLLLRSSGRDLLTSTGGGATLLDERELAATVEMDPTGNDGYLRELSVGPAPVDHVDRLIGRRMSGGFRREVSNLIPDDRSNETLLVSLLDMVPIGALLSGYAEMQAGDHTRFSGSALTAQAGVCAGWRGDGSLMVTIRRTGAVPTPSGAPAPELTLAEDADSWQPVPELAVGDMRRARRLDVSPTEAGWSVDAMMRDTLMVSDGEIVLHEWWVSLTTDREMKVTGVIADPRVLPWTECVSAAATGSQLVGASLADPASGTGLARGEVACTHLNDTLRNLSWAPALRHHIVVN